MVFGIASVSEHVQVAVLLRALFSVIAKLDKNLVPIRDFFETTGLQLAAHALMQLDAVLKKRILVSPVVVDSALQVLPRCIGISQSFPQKGVEALKRQCCF